MRGSENPPMAAPGVTHDGRRFLAGWARREARGREKWGGRGRKNTRAQEKQRKPENCGKRKMRGKAGREGEGGARWEWAMRAARERTERREREPASPASQPASQPATLRTEHDATSMICAFVYVHTCRRPASATICPSRDKPAPGVRGREQPIHTLITATLRY
ncbi:hypothetical protein E2C01_061604 [Portunus trituberculatus]|uniref:Uncharacterized protein n=1 Tax=Portunus trituberculatus TaxID=210409 RepID=A0A5B7HEV4_PORTR|nr:hypothetical protein [Portunus trituberculatus]